MLHITRGTVQRAQRVTIYGPEGIGKSTFAGKFPSPVFIDTEGSTDRLDVARFPRPVNFDQVMGYAKALLAQPHEFRTLVIDTADWAEKLAAEQICAKANKAGIEDFGYGKGYVWLAELFGQFLKTLDLLRDRGIHVVFTAHAQIRKFEQPDEAGAYDRYELKCSRTISPLLKEWSDMLLFVNFKTIVEEGENGKARARGGKKRVMYTTHCAAWDAKNRHGLAEELPFEFEAIAGALMAPAAATPAATPPAAAPPAPAPAAPSPAAAAPSPTPAASAPTLAATPAAAPAPAPASAPQSAPTSQAPVAAPPVALPPVALPPAENQPVRTEATAFAATLYNLMALDGVRDEELRAYLLARKFITPDQSIHNLPEKFVTRMTEDANWAKVIAWIKDARLTQANATQGDFQ